MDTFGGSHVENSPLAPILRERLVGTSPAGNGRRTTQSSRMSRSGWLGWYMVATNSSSILHLVWENEVVY